MNLISLLGLILIIAGAYFLIVPHAILIGLVCVVVGLVLVGGLGIGGGYRNW